MPTKNQRIAAYLPTHINEQLQTFKAERSIKGDSQALIVILSEFLGVSQEVTHQSGSVNPQLQERVEVLEEKIAQLKDELLSELRRELLQQRSSSIEQAKAEVKDELLSELKGESPKPEDVPGQLELIPKPAQAEVQEEAVPVQSLSETDLAARLQSGGSTLREWKRKGLLLEKTRAKDPDGVGWVYLPEIKQYQPESNVFDGSLEAQKSELPDTTEPEF